MANLREHMTQQTIHHLPRLGITNAMRLFGLTARALRFYEEKGLIEARRDRLNARYYDAAARSRLEWIARLRQADISLQDIEEVLQSETDEGLGRECAVQKISARREALLAQLQRVDRVLSELNAAAPAPARRLGRKTGA